MGNPRLLAALPLLLLARLAWSDPCDAYILNRPKPATVAACSPPGSCAQAIQACFKGLEDDLACVRQPPDENATLKVSVDPRFEGARCAELSADRKTAYLFAAHEAYRELKRWRKALDRQAASPAVGDQGSPHAAAQALVDLRTAEERVDSRIHPLMRTAAGVEPFFGVLLAGPVVEDVGKEADGSDTTTRATAFVAFESKHLGQHEAFPLHASLAGRFGYGPVFAMTVPQGAGADAPASPSHPGGFVWDVGPSLHASVKNVVEFTALGRFGQTRLGNAQVVDLDGTDLDYIAVPSDSGTGRTKNYWSYGFRVVFFRGDEGLVSAHERGYLLPAGSLDFGWKRDLRFRDDPRLAGYVSPADRMYFAFRLNMLKVLQAGKSDSPVDVTFGVEHEWARRKGGLPAGTKFLFGGSANLLKLFGSNPAS